MINKAYILTFDRESDKDYSDFHKKLEKLTEVKYWFHYIKSSYIMISDVQTATKLNELIKEIIPNTRFLILEVDLNNSNGYLPEQGWTWIRKHRNKKNR
jgi:hypothetical protein